jgi:hypothetical protein
MSEPGDLEARVDALEENNRLLNAMCEDLTDLRTHVDNGFAEVRGRLDGRPQGRSGSSDC